MASTLSNICKKNHLGDKDPCYDGVGISNSALWFWDMGCRKGRQGRNISLWNVVLEEAAWVLVEKSHLRWTHTVAHWQITITNGQDWSAQAKTIWSWDNLERKITIQGTLKETHRKVRPKLRWKDGLKKIYWSFSLHTLPFWRWQMPVEWRKSSFNELSMGPENKDSRS